MPESQGGRGPVPTTVFDRIVGSLPTQYREEMARMANRIRDRLPPIMVEHRIDALERHLDVRLDEIEKKLDQVLGRIEKQ